MRQLNYRVDNKGEAPAKVARDFLSAHGLISDKSSYANSSEGTVVVGSKEFTEQEILGEILSILIENSSAIRVDRKLNLGGTMICFNALKSGDIDLYVEYTGTGLVTILKENVIQDPQETYQVVKEKFSHQYNLTWLSSFGFNNTYTLTMTSDQAKSLKITTISDLARFVGQEN
jgi:glycine betaine/choline ABC-type transport system substrate-binding protein